MRCIIFNFHCVRIGLLPHPHTRQIRRRLDALRMSGCTLDPARIHELAVGFAGIVYLISFSELGVQSLNTLHVHLVRASRRFIVFGGKTFTAEIVAALREGAADLLDELASDERWFKAGKL